MNNNLGTTYSGSGSPNLRINAPGGSSYTDVDNGNIWTRPANVPPGSTEWTIKDEGGLDDAVVTLNGVQTLTNKTINGYDNTLLNIGVESLTSEAVGSPFSTLAFIDTTKVRSAYWPLTGVGEILTGDFTLGVSKQIPSTLPTEESIVALTPSQTDQVGTGSFRVSITSSGLVVATHNATGSRVATVTLDDRILGKFGSIFVTRVGVTLSIYINGDAIEYTESTTGTSAPLWSQSLVSTYLLAGGTISASSSTYPTSNIGIPLFWFGAMSAADIVASASGYIPEEWLISGGILPLQPAVNNIGNTGYTTFSNGTTTGFSVTKISGSGQRGAGWKIPRGVVINKGYRATATLTVNSGTVPYIRLVSAVNDNPDDVPLSVQGAISAGAVDITLIATATDDTAYIVFGNGASAVTDYTVSNFHLRRNGLVIYPVVSPGNSVLDLFGRVNGFISTGAESVTGNATALDYYGDSYAELPTSFPWTPNFQIYRGGNGTWRTTLNTDSYRKTPETILYVDGRAGSDANNGSTWALAYATLSACLAGAGYTGSSGPVLIYIMGDTFYGRDESINSTTFGTKDVSLIAAYGRVRLANGDRGGALTWAQESVPNDDVWSATVSDPVYLVMDEYVLTEDGYFTRYTEQASIAACQATPGSFFYSAGTLYVHTLRSDEPDNKVVSYYEDTTNFLNQTNRSTFYMEGIDWEGGVAAFEVPLDPASPFDTPTGLIAVNCRFLYAAEDNFSPLRPGLIVAKNCTAAYGVRDGFNYRARTDSYILEEGCIALKNGLNTTSGDNQGSTSHGQVIIRVGGLYTQNQDQNIADVNNCYSWAVGCTAALPASVASGYQSNGLRRNFDVHDAGDGAAFMWIDSCNSIGEDINDYYAESDGSIMYMRRVNSFGKSLTNVRPY